MREMNEKCHYYYDYHNKGTSYSMYCYVPVTATKYCNVNPGRVHYVYLNVAYENSVSSSSNLRVLPFPRQLLSIWFREMNCTFVQVGMNKFDLKCYYCTICLYNFLACLEANDPSSFMTVLANLLCCT